MGAAGTFGDISLFSLRFFQLASAVIVLGTLGYVETGYHFHGSKRSNFVLAQAAISTFYTLCTCLLTLIAPQLILIGLYWSWELIMLLMWVAAFIVDAKVHGDFSCGHNKHTATYESKRGSMEDYQRYGGEYNPYTGKYTDNLFKHPCRVGKASIAFAGLSFVLFLISTSVLGARVLTPIYRKYGMSGMFMSGTSMNNKLNRLHGLTLDQPLDGTDFAQYDAEQQAAHDSASSQEYNQEKLNEQPRASGDTAVQA
ncbi:putative membrane protein [Nakaseomyces bracarensis]|uniref:Membrane protein n=1 Tax=Nakaseomyces bracarensis TaxID=273131 RepID=A0ABR4NN66_9SACH